MKLTGTIVRSDVEGGHWLLKADSGDHYRLTGKLEGIKDGIRAEVEGKVDNREMGFAMMGPHFAVHSLKVL